VIPVAVVVAIAIAVMVRAPKDEGPAWIAPVVTVGLIVLVAVVALMSRLEVTVDQDAVVAAFGFGWPRRTIPLDEIARTRQVRNNFWYGFGVRKVPRGWMYNVWGLDGVELELTNGKIFRIGSNDAERLHASITLAMTT